MKIIYKPRQSGKTLEVIKMSAETGYRIVCHSQSECSRVFHVAQEMGLNIPFPMSIDEFIGLDLKIPFSIGGLINPFDGGLL
mgnify:FL=1